MVEKKEENKLPIGEAVVGPNNKILTIEVYEDGSLRIPPNQGFSLLEIKEVLRECLEATGISTGKRM